jgi:hypothetical protein
VVLWRKEAIRRRVVFESESKREVKRTRTVVVRATTR